MNKARAAIRIGVCIFALVPMLAIAAGSGPDAGIIPKPLKLSLGQGRMTLDTQTVVRYSEGAKNDAEFLAGSIRTASGLPLLSEALGGTKPNCIDFLLNSSLRDLGDEGYRLQISRARVRIEARTAAGLFYAGESLRQLLPVEAFSPTKVPGVEWSLPCLEITDKPRFGWRGMHLDVSRHFYPADFIKKYIDLLSIHKMNIFHWHLVDDGGWRLEIKKYPLLTQRGAWRSTPPKENWDYGNIAFPEARTGSEYGGFYSQQEVREIVAYAAERHITIVPEIEMPGHTWPSTSAYPELGCDLPDGYRVPSNLPGDNVYCAGKEEIFQFLEDVLTETMALFPSQYIHIGGDEVDKRFWKLCPKCQARIKAEGLKNENELQSYFIRRINRFLQAHGRKLIGWDEILEGGLAQGATVMSWRGISGGIAAVKQGKRAIMSPTSHCYFDYAYSLISTERVYLYEPVPKEIADRPEMILGTQGNVWTEWMPESTDVERMAFPRAIAMAEVAWCAKEGKNLAGFLRRLAAHYPRLDYRDVHYRIPQPEAASNAILFEKATHINFPPPPLKSLKLHYTVDGSQPTLQSPIFSKPIDITRDTDVKAAYIRSDGAASDVTMVSCRRHEAVSPGELRPGLTASYYEGRWSRVPDFGALSPAKQQTVTRINHSMGQRPEYYALRFEGYIRILRPGTYTLSLSSDDGSWLRIAGATVVDHDGPHATSEKTGRISLAVGFYPLEIGFFQASGGRTLSARIAGPAMRKRAFAGDMLFHKQKAKKP